MRLFFLLAVASIMLFAASFANAQTASLLPQTVSLCEVFKNLKAYSGKKLQVRANVISEFESFTFHDPSCSGERDPGVWLMFGGDVDCPTPSTWNDVYRPKAKNVKFDGVEYALVKDQSFRNFYNLVTKKPDKKHLYEITATLEGTFIAGEVGTDSGGRLLMPGYGHLGCCHLFIIHQISQVESKKKPKA